MSDSFDLTTIFRIIQKWKKPILIACAIAVLGSIIITMPFIMPPYYKSRVVFYASNPALTDRHNLFRTEAGDIPISTFGDEQDNDRLLSIAKSTNISAFAVKKFNLFKHYKIDPKKEAFPNYKVNKEFEDNYKVVKNELGAIEMYVSDKDSMMAAYMANEIMYKVDAINAAMIKKNDAEVLKMFEERVKEKRNALLSVSDSLKNINTGDNARARFLEEQYENSIKDMNKLSTLYEQYKITGNKEISTIYVVEKAQPSEKKDRPVRWIIVTAALLITFFLSVLTALIVDRMKRDEVKVNA